MIFHNQSANLFDTAIWLDANQRINVHIENMATYLGIGRAQSRFIRSLIEMKDTHLKGQNRKEMINYNRA